jgi:dephospho-CoA kinase
MIIAGLTGGIACGKSTVSKTLLAGGCAIVDADIIARQVVEPGSTGLRAIMQAFGPKYVMDNGMLDRPKLGALIFGNQEKRSVLDRIMLPLIALETATQIQKYRKADCQVLIYDAALIVEMGHADKYRPLIVVECQQDAQVERLMRRNSLTRREAMDRINAQIPVAQKVALADFIINTDGTIEQSVEQTENVLLCLKVLLRNKQLEAEGKR